MSVIRRHPVVVVFAIVVSVLVFWFAQAYVDKNALTEQRRGGGAVLVVAALVQPKSFVDQVESIGTALANESVQLTSKVTETVTRVNFDDGHYVTRGDILVELTNAEETALLSESKANVEETTRQFERLENLIKQKLASETQLDVERNRMRTAQARFEGVVARLDDRLIRAPFDGVLGFRNISEGTLLTPNTPVTTLDDVSSIKFDFAIPELYIAQVQPGQQVVVSNIAYPGQTFIGQVTTVGSRIDPATRTVTVRAKLSNEDLLLRPGMLLNVRLVLSRQEYLAVPEAAVMPLQDKQFVYRVSDSKAERVEFVAGRRTPGYVEVLSGLSDGDQVVIEGLIKIRPGSEVEVREASHVDI